MEVESHPKPYTMSQINYKSMSVFSFRQGPLVVDWTVTVDLGPLGPTKGQGTSIQHGNKITYIYYHYYYYYYLVTVFLFGDTLVLSCSVLLLV